MPNILGLRMAGQKNRRKMKPLTLVCLSISLNFFITSMRMFVNTIRISLNKIKRDIKDHDIVYLLFACLLSLFCLQSLLTMGSCQWRRQCDQRPS